MMAPMISNGSNDLVSSWCHFPADHGMLTISLVRSCHHCHSGAKIDCYWFSKFSSHTPSEFGDSMSTVNLVWTMEGSCGFSWWEKCIKMHFEVWDQRCSQNHVSLLKSKNLLPPSRLQFAIDIDVSEFVLSVLMQGTTARCASLRLKLCEGTMDHWHSPVCTSLLQQTDPPWSTIQAANQTKAESTPQPVEKDVRVMSGKYGHDSHGFIALICLHMLGLLQQCCLMLVARIFRMFFVVLWLQYSTCILQPFPIRGSCQLSSHAGDRTRLGRWDIMKMPVIFEFNWNKNIFLLTWKLLNTIEISWNQKRALEISKQLDPEEPCLTTF